MGRGEAPGAQIPVGAGAIFGASRRAYSGQRSAVDQALLQARLAHLDNVELCSEPQNQAQREWPEQLGVIESVAWLLGESGARRPASVNRERAPSAVSRTLTEFFHHWGLHANAQELARIKKWIPRLIGTNKGDDAERAADLYDWMLRRTSSTYLLEAEAACHKLCFAQGLDYEPDPEGIQSRQFRRPIRSTAIEEDFRTIRRCISNTLVIQGRGERIGSLTASEHDRTLVPLIAYRNDHRGQADGTAALAAVSDLADRFLGEEWIPERMIRNAELLILAAGAKDAARHKGARQRQHTAQIRSRMSELDRQVVRSLDAGLNRIADGDWERYVAGA